MKVLGKQDSLISPRAEIDGVFVFGLINQDQIMQQTVSGQDKLG